MRNFFKNFKKWQLAVLVFAVVLAINVLFGTLKYGLFYMTVPTNLFDEGLDISDQTKKRYLAFVEKDKWFKKWRAEIKELVSVRKNLNHFEIILRSEEVLFNYYANNYNRNLLAKKKQFLLIEKNVPEGRRLKKIENIKIEFLNSDLGTFSE